MPIASPRYPFVKGALEGAPEDPGVYELYEREELVYVGYAELPAGIQSRLLQHYYALREPARASHYAWEICRDPRTRHAALLMEFERLHLRRPRCNPPSARPQRREQP